MENGENGWQLSVRIGTAPPPSIRLHRVTLKISDCAFDCVYLHLILSRCITFNFFPNQEIHFKKRKPG